MKYIKNLINNILYLLKHDIKLVNDIKSINTSIYEMENALSHHIKKIDELEKNMINNKTQDSLNAIDDIIHKSTYGTLKDIIVNDVFDDLVGYQRKIINELKNKCSLLQLKDVQYDFSQQIKDVQYDFSQQIKDKGIINKLNNMQVKDYDNKTIQTTKHNTSNQRVKDLGVK